MVENDAFAELAGAELSGVTFVRDYLQFQFDPPPVLNAFTPVTVCSASGQARSGEPAFPKLVVDQINKKVESVHSTAEQLELVFKDGSSITISLRAEDYVGPEAINLRRRDGTTVVA